MSYTRRRPDWWPFAQKLDNTLDPADIKAFEDAFVDIDARVIEIEENGVQGSNPPTLVGVEQKIAGSITLAANQNGVRIVATAAPIAVTLPSVGVLGDGFECTIWNDSASGGDITISGDGDTDVTVPHNDGVRVGEINGKQWVWTLNTPGTRVDNISLVEDWNPSMLGPDLVLWWDAHQNVTYDGFSFAVSSWTDRASAVAATQSNGALKPIYDPVTKEMRFSNNQQLVIPGRSRPYQEHWWLACTIRVNWSAITANDTGLLWCINGFTGGRTRQPSFQYNSTTDSIVAVWGSETANNDISVVASGDETWHTIVSRRTPDGVYISMDGGAETFVSCQPAMNLVGILGGQASAGFIGDFRTYGIEFGLDSIVLGQRLIEQEDIDKLHGWGLWRVGAQDQLPVDHPYVDDPPPVEDVRLEIPDGNDEDAYPWWGGDLTILTTNRGDALDRTGFTLAFEEDWDSAAGITQNYGAGPWYTPMRPDTSIAKYYAPDLSPTYTPFTIEEPSVLTITMKKIGGLWYTGIAQTVNSLGEGFHQKYGYFEAKLKFQNVPYASWPAFWMYAYDQEWFCDSMTRAEIDIVEVYASDPAGHHCSVHRAPAPRPQPGHLSGGRIFDSQITYVDRAPGNAIWTGMSSFFDDQWHLYGCRKDDTDIRFYLDDLEIGRVPIYPEADRDVFMVIGQAIINAEANLIEGPVTYKCDWVRAWNLP